MGKLDGLELYSPWPFQGQSIKVKGNLHLSRVVPSVFVSEKYDKSYMEDSRY